MSPFDLNQLWPNWIAGQWETDAVDILTVDNPATGKALARIACAGKAEVDRAVTAARKAFQSSLLQTSHPRVRAELMFRIAERIRAHRDEGARILCLESGKPLRDAYGEFDEAARYFEYYGGIADKLEGKSIPLGEKYMDFTVYEPYGVSAQIIPWNFPVSLCARSLAPALAAGNAVVLKSPELTPLGMVFIAKACEEAGVPAGMVNLLCGLGHEAGAALVAHPGVDQIVFTGSAPTGQRIMHAAAERVVPCVLELGGKSAAIVYPDANLSKVLESVRNGIFLNAGQVCSALSRLVIHDSIYDETIKAISEMIQGLSIGDGLDNADITPVISAAQRDKIANLCNQAVEQGARLVTGGQVVDRPGYFYAPTLFADVTKEMAIAQEEVFGPVLVAIRYQSEEEAIQLANGTPFGLVSGVFTNDINLAMRAAQKLEASQVFVNEWFAGGIETPFGGRKRSGFGREKGIEAIYNYLQTKNIAIAL